MQEPIKKDDMCVVIGGALGPESPNKGKIVTVRQLKGEHSEFGKIWKCEGRELVTELGCLGMFADFASSWLKKIEPPKNTKLTEKEKELVD